MIVRNVAPLQKILSENPKRSESLRKLMPFAKKQVARSCEQNKKNPSKNKTKQNKTKLFCARLFFALERQTQADQNEMVKCLVNSNRFVSITFFFVVVECNIHGRAICDRHVVTWRPFLLYLFIYLFIYFFAFCDAANQAELCRSPFSFHFVFLSIYLLIVSPRWRLCLGKNEWMLGTQVART